MLPPHPLLRVADLWHSDSSTRLPDLIANAGVHPCFNARAALYHLALALKSTGRSKILLPAFHCPSVVEPILRGGMQPVFYRIDRSLSVDLADISRRLDSEVAAVVFINFFGFPSTFEPLKDELSARSIAVIEDCAHSFLSVDPISLAGMRADITVYGFWKLVAAQVGGGLWMRPGFHLPLPKLRRPPIRNSIVRAKHLIDELVEDMGPNSATAHVYKAADSLRARLWRAAPTGRNTPFPTADDTPSIEYFFDERLASSRMPWLSRRILAAADLAELASARRRNYLAYAEGLDSSQRLESLYAELPSHVCPWAYPALLEDRILHDIRLRERNVPVWTFGSTLHRVLFQTLGPEDAALQDAQYLSDRLLCLPVHQTLEVVDVQNFIATISDYLHISR